MVWGTRFDTFWIFFLTLRALQVRTVDATGTFCPVPVLMTAREIQNISPGETLEVLGNDPGILEDMPAWCQETGHRLVSMDQKDDLIRCVVEKAAS